MSVEHRLLWGCAEEYRSRLKSNGLSGNINTSFVERANLTIRQSVSKLTRRTWGPTHLTSELEDQLYWWLAYYHFVRPHESLRVRLPEPILRKGKQRPRLYQKMTPAMAAGITSRRWSVMVPVSAREGTDQFSAAIMRVRLPEPIQRKGKQRPRLYEKMTPAMAAGITSRRWSVKDLISFPLP